MMETLIPREAVSASDLTEVWDRVPPECECSLCDLPLGAPHESVVWRLVWEFNRPPAAVTGEVSMLLCDHCLRDWRDNPDDFGGDPVRYHPI